MLWCNNFTLFKPSALLRVFSYSENMGKTNLIERIETASKYSDHPHDALWGGMLEGAGGEGGGRGDRDGEDM